MRDDYMSIFEKSYSTVMTNIFRAVNPIKKRIMKTECKVHKYINEQAIIILKNDNSIRAYNLFHAFIKDINTGVVWADQDLKSSNHFYNPEKDRGLYGRSNAYKEYMIYYSNAINLYFSGEVRAAMFYLGAACHLIQDMTVPQHVNIRLLGQHKKYENWVKKMYLEYDYFKVTKGGIYLDSPAEYIHYNSTRALEIYKKHKFEEEIHKKFHDITAEILTLAQKTTAGLMMNFYNNIEEEK
jgi:phospholipase C